MAPVKTIKPGQKGYKEIQTHHKGKPDVVSPEMNPIIEEMEKNGETTRQLIEGDPFTISQIRYWAPRGSAVLPEGKRIRVGSHDEDGVINITIVEDKRAALQGNGEKATAKATKKRAPKKPAAKKPTPKRRAKKATV